MPFGTRERSIGTPEETKRMKIEEDVLHLLENGAVLQLLEVISTPMAPLSSPMASETHGRDVHQLLEPELVTQENPLGDRQGLQKTMWNGHVRGVRRPLNHVVVVTRSPHCDFSRRIYG